jgi:flagellin-like hook-associated protein FlgL
MHMTVKRILITGILFLTLLTWTAAASSSRDYLNRILGNNETELDKSGKRLSQGTFLLPDNPANHGIYEKLEDHIRGLDRYIKNNGDLISYYQTAEGYLQTITDLLQTIRELIIKRSNTIYSREDREYIDTEIYQYYDQILFTLENAEFNKKRIFEDLLQDAIIRQRFREKDYIRLSHVDALSSFFLRQRSLYGAVTNTLALRNQGMAINSENMSEFQGSLWYVDVSSEVSRLKKYHLLFLINLLLLNTDERMERNQ